MNPNRVDFLIDLAYGVLLFFSIVLIVSVGTGIGIAFGLGALVSYIIHVAWKMARFDPAWMTAEVAESVGEKVTEEVSENVEEKVAQEVSENVEEKVAQEVTESVEEKVTQEVTESVEATLSEDIDSIIDRLEEVNERIDRRPREDEIGKGVEVTGSEPEDDDRNGESRASGNR